MSISSLAQRTSGLTAANASCSLVTPATVRAKVLEVSVIQATGTAMSLGLARPASAGTPTGPVAFQPDDPGDPASVIVGHITWSVQPGTPTIFHRRWNSAATIGLGIVWSFPRGLVVPISSSLVMWNISTAVAYDCNIVIDE